MGGDMAWLLLTLVGVTSDFVGGTFCASKDDIGDAGIVRLANGDSMCWRNAANDGNACISVSGDDRLMVPPYTRNQHMFIGAATLGPTAPTSVTVGNARCLQFAQAQTAETAHLTWIIPGEWDGASDIQLHMRVFPEAGDAMADGEVIEFDVTYNVLEPGDQYDQTSVTVSPTYTQSGAGADKAMLCLDATLDYDHGSVPLVANHEIFASIDLDEAATTYSGDPILCQLHTRYTADTLEGRAP